VVRLLYCLENLTYNISIISINSISSNNLMKSFIIHFQKFDWPLIIAALLLSGIGLLSIYSSSVGRGDFTNLRKQIVFLAIGVFLMFAISFFDWRMLRTDPYLILVFYFICLILLLGLFFFAPTIRGIKSWYKIGDISIDPIEPTKIVLIILMAKYFSMRHIEMYRVIHILISGFYVFLPSFLIFLQPDMGSVLVLVSLWIGVLIISGIKLRHFLILVLCGLLVLAFGWSTFLKEYQRQRIMDFLLPQFSDPLKIGWSQRQAKIAIGSGGIFGQGITKGSQTQYGFLSEPQTDFIFSAIAEEMGLIGVFIFLSLFLFLIWRIIRIAIESSSNFPRLFAIGIAVLLFSQIFIHSAMNLGILPIIGISLPLMSYGGSGLVSIFAGLGILQGIKRSGG
jgi:rod shape determining protein RodA